MVNITPLSQGVMVAHAKTLMGYICIYMYIYLSIYPSISLYMYIYIYIYREHTRGVNNLGSRAQLTPSTSVQFCLQRKCWHERRCIFSRLPTLACSWRPRLPGPGSQIATCDAHPICCRQGSWRFRFKKPWC